MMSRQNDLQKLISNHQRRLQKLKEQKATLGLSADPSIDIEIEDIETTIAWLQAELDELKTKQTEAKSVDERLAPKKAEVRHEANVDPKELFWTYLNQVVSDTGTLDLSGIYKEAASNQELTQLELTAVYTALDTQKPIDAPRIDSTTSLHQHDRRPQSVLSFVNETLYAALLGDPGSGKTTFSNFLALCLAGERLKLEHANFNHLGPEWAAGQLLPVRVILRDFAAEIPLNVKPDNNTSLWAFITQSLGTIREEFTPLLKQHLLEQGGLLILDGLDEVPEAQRRREKVKEAILVFRHSFPRVRILLTSRTYAYQRQGWRLPGFDEATIAPLSLVQIWNFVDSWYNYFAKIKPGLSDREASARAYRFKRAIAEREYLHKLAEQPLLLTLMISLHTWRHGWLPDQREQLYEESVELLLDIWERPKIVHDENGEPLLQTSAAEWLSTPQKAVRNALAKLAYDVHSAQDYSTGIADIGEGEIVTALQETVQNIDLRPRRIIEYIRDRAGLLVNHGEGIYRFPHRTFQEYMAAVYLTQTNFPYLLVQQVRKNPEQWREVLLLAAAKVARGTPYACWALLNKLCSVEYEDNNVTDIDWWTAYLSSLVMIETDILPTSKDPELDQDDRQIAMRIWRWIIALVSGGHLPPKERANASIILAILGDPRQGVDLRDNLPDIDWVTVEAGPFLMGSDPEKDEYAKSEELPQFTCDSIKEPYRISRYPVTNAQYQMFINAGGYEDSSYWKEAQTVGRWHEGRVKIRHMSKVVQDNEGKLGYEYEEDWVSQPIFAGWSNQPQVGISWYEAVAFCRWLSEQMNCKISLPTEPQWEKAARGTDGRLYGWGNEYNANLCNMVDTGIHTLCPVGIFPLGVSPYGCHDMSGNVWEWTLSLWGRDENKTEFPYKYDPNDGRENLSAPFEVLRIVRGSGYYRYDVQDARCAFRGRDLPALSYPSVGFRVVCLEMPG